MKKLTAGVALLTALASLPALAANGVQSLEYSHSARQGGHAFLRLQTAPRARVEVVDGDNGAGHKMFRTTFADNRGVARVEWSVGHRAHLGTHTVTAYAYRTRGNFGKRLGPAVIHYQVRPEH